MCIDVAVDLYLLSRLKDTLTVKTGTFKTEVRGKCFIESFTEMTVSLVCTDLRRFREVRVDNSDHIQFYHLLENT